MIGILGTTLSVLGILDRFVDFLTVLGVVFPPIIGIMLVDYYLLRSHRKITDESRRTGQLPNETPTIGWAAIVASIAGGAVGLATEWGVPTINSLVAASLLYWCSNWPSAGRKTAGLTEVALIFAHELMHSSGNGECFMLEKGGRNGKNGPIARTNGHDS